MIVQAWRGSHWQRTDLDSILILTFSKDAGGARISLVHANIPDHDYAGIQKGWPKHYWKPWRVYLKHVSRRG
jgi:hypothetical protein